jgi:hypothetical protein
MSLREILEEKAAAVKNTRSEDRQTTLGPTRPQVEQQIGVTRPLAYRVTEPGTSKSRKAPA